MITALLGVHEIYVTARTSSFQYKLASVDIGRAARELGVQFMVTGRAWLEGNIVDGLTASITFDLTRIRDAFVVAAAVALKFKGKPIDLQQIGKDQGV